VEIDRDQLAREGFTVVRAVAPERLLEAARQVVTSFLGVDLAGPATWYPREPLEWGVVPVHQAQALWDLRQLPAIHQVFAELLGTEALWVSQDRAIYRVPDRPPEHVDHSRLHWDLDPRASRPPVFQGMLFLTDTPADQGPFEGVPGLFADLEAWLAAHPELDLEAPIDLAGHEVVPAPARAGDLVVWDARLPHRGAPNRGRAPRLSVAIAMGPEGGDEERAERIACWREKRAPAWFRGWPGQVDPEPGAPAELTPLGRKLLGLDRW
jgi:hypothetical protein